MPDVTLKDLDPEAIAAFMQKVGATDTAGLLRSRGLYLDAGSRHGVTQAGWLLFGRTTPMWSYVRFLQYRGTTVETGTRSNLTEDIRIEGTIPHIIDTAKEIVGAKLGTVIRQVPGGRFEDRLEIESPGRLPGLVRVQNIQNARYSRNPHIARVLADMTGYVRELNEGVRRMFDEMRGHGLQEPVYRSSGTGVKVVLFTQPVEVSDVAAPDVSPTIIKMQRRLGDDKVKALLTTFASQSVLTTKEVTELLGLSVPTARGYLSELEALGLVVEDRKAKYDPHAVWRITASAFWTPVEISSETTTLAADEQTIRPIDIWPGSYHRA